MLRAANLFIAAAVLLACVPSWAHSPPTPRSPIPRAWQQKPPAPKPGQKPGQKPTTPAKKPAPAKKKIKITPAAGTVTRPGDATSPAGPVFDENANAQSLINDALERAKANNRRVLIHWGANWCDACQRLDAVMKSDAGLQRLMQYEYDLVLVDVGTRNRNLDVALSYGVAPQASGVPWLSVLSAEGEPICNLHANRFLDERGAFDAGKLADFLRGYQAMYPPADGLLNRALADARTDGKVMLVQFSAPLCTRCSQLESWFARSDVDGILSRNFSRLRIDVDRTVGGRDVLRRFSKAWQTSLPWFVLLNSADGSVLATSDSLDGKSIADLGDDVAIARFGDLLRANAKTITPEEFDWLLKSLHEMNSPPGDSSPAKAGSATAKRGESPTSQPATQPATQPANDADMPQPADASPQPAPSPPPPADR